MYAAWTKLFHLRIRVKRWIVVSLPRCSWYWIRVDPLYLLQHCRQCLPVSSRPPTRPRWPSSGSSPNSELQGSGQMDIVILLEGGDPWGQRTSSSASSLPYQLPACQEVDLQQEIQQRRLREWQARWQKDETLWTPSPPLSWSGWSGGGGLT